MDLFGVGSLELIVILLVALMVLGPARMMELSRTIGKFWSEARRSVREMVDMASVPEEKESSAEGEEAKALPEPAESVARDGPSPGEGEKKGREPARRPRRGGGRG